MVNIINLTRQEAIDLCNSRTGGFTNQEVKTIISTMNSKSSLKPTVTDGIQVGDVISATGLNHPGVVFRIDQDAVYTILLTTDVLCAATIKQCTSRLFPTSFFTATINITTRVVAEQNVFAIYDNIKDLKVTIRAIKALYRTILTKQKQ